MSNRGRPRKSKSPYPPCYREHHGAVWYVKGGAWTRLPDVHTPADAHRHYAASLEHGTRETSNLATLIDQALAVMVARTGEAKLAPETIRKYSAAARIIKKHARAFQRPDQVKQRDVAMLKKLLARTPNMANKVMSFGRLVWADFLESQLVDENPFVAVKMNKEHRRTRLYTWEEWWAIHDQADARLKLIMDGLYLTDRRIGDVLKLDERDILEHGIQFKEQKTGKPIIVEWNDDLRAWVAACRALRGKVERVSFERQDRARPLIRGRGGKKADYSTVGRQWRAALAAARVNDEPVPHGTIHDGRAFSATEAKRQGRDPQALLNHTDAATTRIYLRGKEVPLVKGPTMKRRGQ